MDKGPWITIESPGSHHGWRVASCYFKYDVTLEVTGDFANADERRRYCEWLRDTLNKATANEDEP